MSNFYDVIKVASKLRQEKEIRYKKLRQDRWVELQALAEEGDLMLDGRRTRFMKHKPKLTA